MRKTIVGFVLAAALAGCSSAEPKSDSASEASSNATASSQAEASSSPTEAAASSLIPVKLPPGSTVSATEGIEVWETPEKNYWTSFGTLREQLPVGEQFEGLTWCDDDVRPPNFVQWTWGDAAEMIVVAVNKDGQIQIIRGPDTTGFGCY